MGLTSFVFGNNQWYEADCMQITMPNGTVINATTHQTDLMVGGTKYYATKYGKWSRGKVAHEKNAVTEMDLLLNCNEAIQFPIQSTPGIGAQLASDNFTRANSNPIGGNWTTLPGCAALQLLSNSARGTTNSGVNGAYNTSVGWTPDQYCEITVGTCVANTDWLGAAVRLTASGSTLNGYVAYVQGPLATGQVVLDKYTAGSASLITSVSVAVNAGDTLRLEVIGSFLVVRQNGKIILTATDTSYTSGVAGILCLNTVTAGNSSATSWNAGTMLMQNASTDNLLAADNFTRANANPIGGAWSTIGFAVQLASNAAKGTQLNNLDSAIYTGVTFTNDHWSEITIGALPTNQDQAAAMARFSAGYNGYLVYVVGPLGPSAQVQLTKYVSGSPTQLSYLSGVTVSAGDKFRLEAQGTQLTVKQNGVVIMQVTDSTFASGTPGIGFVDGVTIGNATITNWQGGSITQGNPNVAIYHKSKLFIRSKVLVTVAYLDLPTNTVQGTYVAFIGYVTQNNLESTVATFKCSDPGYLMQLNWPRRVIQAACPYAWADAQCTLNKASFQQTRTVVYGSNGTNLVVSSALAAIGNDALPFTQGYIVAVTGQCAGWSIPITNQISSTQLTLGPFDLPLQVGDQIVLTPGCAHTPAVCQLKYNNLVNFGGFPYVPGPESSITGN